MKKFLFGGNNSNSNYLSLFLTSNKAKERKKREKTKKNNKEIRFHKFSFRFFIILTICWWFES